MKYENTTKQMHKYPNSQYLHKRAKLYLAAQTCSRIISYEILLSSQRAERNLLHILLLLNHLYQYPFSWIKTAKESWSETSMDYQDQSMILLKLMLPFLVHSKCSFKVISQHDMVMCDTHEQPLEIMSIMRQTQHQLMEWTRHYPRRYTWVQYAMPLYLTAKKPFQ